MVAGITHMVIFDQAFAWEFGHIMDEVEKLM